MKETNEKVYRCDHCNKSMVRKGLMVIHERMCKKNPKNMHKCFEYCAHLVKETNEPEEDEYRPSYSFHCNLNPETPLYSYKLERFKSNDIRRGFMTRMPLECDLYECEDGHDFEGCNPIPVSGYQGVVVNHDDFFTNEYYLE